MRTFTFTFSGTVELREDQIWPVGYEEERPDNPTPADVVAWVRGEYSNVSDWADEWNLPIEASVDGEELFE